MGTIAAVSWEAGPTGAPDAGADQNAGVQVLDPAAPPALRRSAPSLPPTRMFDTRSGRPRVTQRCDVLADADLYVTDRDAGRYVLQYEGA